MQNPPESTAAALAITLKNPAIPRFSHPPETGAPLAWEPATSAANNDPANTAMLFKCASLTNYRLECPDGDIGRLTDLYFDDRHWAIRYLVADPKNWMHGRRVLISPHALDPVIPESKRIPVSLSRRQIEDSPPLDNDQLVDSQFEANYHEYYGWVNFWAGSIIGDDPVPAARAAEETTLGPPKPRDPHLHAVTTLEGFHIHATDGGIGQVDDFIVDDLEWEIRYLIIDTRPWWPGGKVLVSPLWIDKLSWIDGKVFVGLTRDAVKSAPPFSSDALVSRDYEARLHGHYQREPYWPARNAETRKH